MSLVGDVATTALSFLGAGMELYGKGLSREDELDADAHGIVIAARWLRSIRLGEFAVYAGRGRTVH